MISKGHWQGDSEKLTRFPHEFLGFLGNSVVVSAEEGQGLFRNSRFLGEFPVRIKKV